jgi:molecular chaperone GrpE
MEGGPEVEESPDLELLQEEIEQLNDRHLRLAAEFDNYRKRVERERAESRARSQAEVVARLLEPLDDLERVASVDPQSTSVPAVLEGVALVERKLRRSLEAVGLEEVDAAGQRFDPTTMDAVLTAPAEGPEQDEMVADVLQKGYRLDGILVRPAKVRVRKHG